MDLRGEPVPAAEVWVTTDADGDERELARGRADGEGLFLLPRVPKAKWWAVHATADGMVVGREYGSPRSRVDTVSLHEAVAVTGTLRDRAGKPVANAPVRATLADARILFRVHCDTVTDANGAFRLDKVPLADVAVRAIVPGEGFAQARLPVTGPCVVALQSGAEPTTSLRVAVTGLPAAVLAKARVSPLPYLEGHLQQLPPQWDRPRLGGDGTVTLDGVPRWDWTVSVYADGYAITPTDVKVKGDGPHDLTFAATAKTAGVPWQGVVLDAAGKPVAGVRFSLRARDTVVVEAVSDERGAFTIPCAWKAGTQVWLDSRDDRWVLEPIANERADPAKRHELSMSNGALLIDVATRLELRAAAACVVDGRVLLANGKPAAFVSVFVGGDLPGQWPAWETFGRGATDRDGRYRMAGVAIQTVPVRVLVNDHAGSGLGDLFALDQVGAVVHAGDMKLSAPATIAGVLTDAKGTPVVGVRVWLRDCDLATGNQRSGSVTEVITDHLGRYRFLGVPLGGARLMLPPESRPLGGPAPRGEPIVMSDPVDVTAGAALTVDLALPGK